MLVLGASVCAATDHTPLFAALVGIRFPGALQPGRTWGNLKPGFVVQSGESKT